MSAPKSGQASSGEPKRGGFWRWFASGGYLLFLVLFASAVVLAIMLPPILESEGRSAVGDRRTVESYGFPLEPLLVPREALASAGFFKDGVRVLDDPPTLGVREAMADDVVPRGKYLVPGQRVLGVVVNGEARAYPLRVLNWHELINDTLGGEEILVTYSPLTDSAMVFSRRVGERVLSFGISGLVANSNQLFYERESPEGEQSLWSQLAARAVAGPAAARGERLEVLPSVVARWGEWIVEEPETTTLAPDPSMAKLYRRNPYGAYFGDERLRFPVTPLPEPEGLPLKARVLALAGRDGWQVIPFEVLIGEAGESGTVERRIDGRAYRFDVDAPQATPPTVVPQPLDGGPLPPSAVALWFAWHAFHAPTPSELSRDSTSGFLPVPSEAGSE